MQLKAGYNLHPILERTETYPTPSTPASSKPSASATPDPSVNSSNKPSAPSPSISIVKVPGYWLTNHGVREAAIFNTTPKDLPSTRITVVIAINPAAKVSGGVFATVVQNMRTDVYNTYIPDDSDIS